MHRFSSPHAVRRMVRMAILMGIVMLIYHSYLAMVAPRHSTSVKYQHRIYSRPETVPNATLDIVEIVRQLYGPFIPSMVDEYFVTPVGKEVQQKGRPLFREPLGKDVLILDVDSRTKAMEGVGGLLNDEPLGWRMVGQETAGLLNHYLFSQLHGYDYRFVKATDFPDRHGTWVKVAAIANALHDYRFVVFMDADASWPNPELPLEWLLNYWQVSPEYSLTMALDPGYTRNDDMYGKTNVNTGFVIAQQNEKTDEIMKEWLNCPEDDKYDGCSHYKYDWPHEQAVFSNYIRYDYPNYIKELPCHEANGCPESKHRDNCMGVLARHCWFHKEGLPMSFANVVMQPFGERLHQWFHKNLDSYYLEAHDNKIADPGDKASKKKKLLGHKKEKPEKDEDDEYDGDEDADEATRSSTVRAKSTG